MKYEPLVSKRGGISYQSFTEGGAIFRTQVFENKKQMSASIFEV